MLKQVEDFNPFNYHGYFFIETDKDIVVKFFTSNGYTVFEDYDIYRFEGFSILAFYEVQANIWIKDFQINYEDKSIVYQFEFYKHLKDILNGETDSSNEFYLFWNSVEIKPSEEFNNLAINAVDRCDYNKFGPDRFYPLISKNAVKIVDFKIILSVTGAGHLIRVQVESFDNAYTDQTVDRQKYINSRTFSGALKMLHEWSEVTKDPWNNTEEIAVKAFNFLQSLNFKEDDFQETIQNQCDMRVVKYLKGDNEYYPLPENKFISDGLKNHFSKYCKYFSLKEIFENHPNGNLIPDRFLNREQSIYQEMISYYCMLNGIDESSTTLKQIHEHAGKKPHYTEEYAFEDYNNLITDVIEKMLGNEFYENSTI